MEFILSNFNKAISTVVNRMVLLGLFVAPITLGAQEAGGNISKSGATSSDVKFFSKAKMYVGEATSDAASTGATMYIEGSAKFANNSATETGTSQIVQVGVTKLTGDFVDAFTTKAEKADTLFAAGSFSADGSPIGAIWFAGEDKIQKIYREAGVNKAVFGYNYINFPTLRVNQVHSAGLDITKNGYVSVDTSAAISVGNLEVGRVSASVAENSAYKGGFAVESSYVGDTQGAETPSHNIRTAYTLIKNINDGYFIGSDGWCRVNYAMWNPADEETNNFDGTVSYAWSGGNNASAFAKTARHLRPFASPFKELPLDYALWQVVLKPYDQTLDSGKGPIVNADEYMKAGEGYLLAQEVSTSGYNNINHWAEDTDSNHRFRGGYEFSRKVLDFYSTEGTTPEKPGFSKFPKGVYKGKTFAEYFNTEDVEVTLKKGFNFVGNPYLVPISLSTLVNAENIQTGNDYGIAQNTESTPTDDVYKAYYRATFATYADGTDAGKGVFATRKFAKPQTATGTIDNAIAARYHVMKNSYIYEIDLTGTWWGSRFKFGTDYYVSQLQGSTTTLELDKTELVGPMGVFCLQRPSDAADLKIKIRRPSEEVFRMKPLALAPKAARSVKFESNELLVQALVDSYAVDDRHSIVFIDKTMDEDKGLSVEKALSTVVDESYRPSVGTIYTKSLKSDKDGNRTPMHINFVPNDIKQMALYVVPPSAGNASTLTLKGYRMETLQDIKSVWVEDRLDGSIKELTKDGLEFTLPVSVPVPGEELDYRFILHFSDTYDLAITDPTKPVGPVNPGEVGDLVVYYRNSDSMLSIENLIDIDANSKVDVYDLQGRLITRFRISGDDAAVGIAERSLSLAQGTYIVRIVGGRNHTSKFLSLQN